MDKLFVGAIFCVDASESNNEEELEEWLGDNVTLSHIT